jgi:hypothetical protein
VEALNSSGNPKYLCKDCKANRRAKGDNLRAIERISSRQIVAFVKLACALPEEYRKCISYSDKYFAYERVFPTETH